MHVPIEIVEGEAAVANVYAQPANLMLYGPPGIGKTTAAISLLCKDGVCSAFCIPCEDGALKTIASLGLPIPAHPKETVKTWGRWSTRSGGWRSRRIVGGSQASCSTASALSRRTSTARLARR